MYDRVIVVMADREDRQFLKEVCEVLRGDIGYKDWAGCSDAEEALEQWAAAPGRDLVIVDQALPDLSDPPEPLGGGVALLRALQARKPTPACILLGSNDRRIKAAAAGWPLWSLLVSDDPAQADLVYDIQEKAKNLAFRRDAARNAEPGLIAPAAALPKSQPWALLDVYLDGPFKSFMRMKIGDEKRFAVIGEQPLQISENKWEQILGDSRALKKRMSECLNNPGAWLKYEKDWGREYEDLGCDIHSVITGDIFYEWWGRGLNATNEKPRLRFILDESAYDGLWESICHPKTKWLMLKGTIARCARTASYVPTRRLDEWTGTLNVLAIASDIPDNSVAKGPDQASWYKFWNGRLYGPFAEQFYDREDRLPRLNEFLPKLPELRNEMSHLQTLQEKLNQRFERREVRTRLDIEFLPKKQHPPGKSLRDQVMERLTDWTLSEVRPQINVVHFAGHAIFNDDQGDNRGYLVFGDDPETEMVPVSEFAGWLREAGVQMVYLSCCRSSAARAAFELAKAGISLAIGFTWDLNSARAVDFAEHFYRALLTNDLKVCNAFQSARRALQDRYGDGDPIWASPVLVAQPDDWLSVERYVDA